MGNWANQKPPLGYPLDKQNPLAQGLVGCWLFNEAGGGIANDISGYGNHGTLTGMANPPTATSGWVGNGLRFDGLNDFVNVSTPTWDLQSQGTWLIDCTYLGSFCDYPYFLSQKNTAGTDPCLGIGTPGTKYVRFIGLESSGFLWDVTTTFPLETIRHTYVMTWDGSKAFFYSDGQVYSNAGTSYSGVVDCQPSNQFAMGTLLVHERPIFMDAYAVYIYNRALTPAEVQQLYIAPYQIVWKPSYSRLFVVKTPSESLITMDYAYAGLPFVYVPATDSVDVKTMDYAYAGLPFVCNGGTTYPIPLNDTVTISDSLSKSISVGLSDSMSMTDALGRSASIVKADTVTIADSLIKQVSLVLADNVAITDSLIDIITILLNLVDTVTISDSLTKSISLIEADTVTIADSLTRSLGLSLTDSMTIADALIRSIALVKSDSVSISDSLTKTIQINITDAVTILETLIKNISINLADSEAIADSLNALVIIPIILSDSVTITDSLTKTIQLVRSDTVSITESLIKNLLVNITDSVSITDTLVRFLSLAFSDSMTITDSLSTTTIKVTYASYTITFTVKKPEIKFTIN